VSFKYRPDIVGGYHLLVNGLFAIIVAKIIGSKSLYVCGGGVRELIGGGYTSENRIFGKLGYADKIIENLLVRSASNADLVIVRGQNTKNSFRNLGVTSTFYIMSGGIDGKKYHPYGAKNEYDFIFVGRLSEIKRVDILLRSIKQLKDRKIILQLVIVGDGPSRSELQILSKELEIDDYVQFVGHKDNIEDWLNKSKFFILTSDSEGLSQALIQGMMCGLPAIVTDVGDLNDLVIHGVSGFLVTKGDVNDLATKIEQLLSLSEDKITEMGFNARKIALKCDVESIAEQWDKILFEVYG
jgi:glycosyltransferase involved in cell wall biosynthesis